jgi:nucleotide-binding universal stress UspA family protein
MVTRADGGRGAPAARWEGNRRRRFDMATILCAVDDSPGAGEAVRTASRLSGELGLRLVLAHVAAGYRLPDGVAGVTGIQARQGAEQLLARIVAEQGLDGSADRRAEVGDRGSEMARIASEEAASLIVVGARTQGRRRRRLLSGLAAELAGTAPCPVLVAPPARR